MQTTAVVLLSGGLDSATVLAMAQAQGFTCHALTLRYGQRHAQELQAAERVASRLGVASWRVLDLDIAQFGGSALTQHDLVVPRHRDLNQSNIPITYVPARNTIFLAYALAWAEVLPAETIFIGVNALDYSGYPDCRPEYLAAFSQMARLATRAGVEGRPLTIQAPLLHLGKAEIIRQGLALGVDYSLTHSCYDPSPAGLACGTCDACLIRLRGFAQVGCTDPITYADQDLHGL